ncbi:MAG: hypothetical protein OXG78_06425 [Chloroflexi bacterium]|nr:hypothetical protein [Chloroflexota bacterium]
MSLQSHNSDQAQAAEPADAAGRQAGSIGRFSGLASASSSPRVQGLLASAPQRATVMLVLLGMVIGLVTAYLIIPTEFTGASPRHMSQQAIQQWVRMVAVGHSEDIHYDDANALIVLRQIPNPQGVVRGLANSVSIPAAERAALDALTDIPGFADLAGALAPQDPGIVGSSLQVILSLIAVALGVPILVIAGRTVYPGRGSDEPKRYRAARPSPTSQVQASSTSNQAVQQAQAFAEAPAADPWAEDETDRSNTIHPQYGVPVLHALSTYVKGRNFDDSFAIELGAESGGQFLGECGVSSATHVGNELQSVEFWGFDMASQETLTKVFAAPAALSDHALQATVASRVKDPTADIIAAEPGAALILDSGAIHIQAIIKTVICNYGGGTPNSAIETLQIELLAWHKQSVQSGVPASGYPAPAASPFNEYADLQFGSPSETTSPTPPPGAGGLSAPRPSSTPLAPKRPEDDEDDPFGGTGNFMPYS